MTIRLRLTLWYGGILALVLVVVGALAWFQLGRSLRSELDDALEVQATDVRAGYDSDSNVSLTVRDPARPGIFSVVYDPAGSLQRATANTPSLAVPPAGASEQTIAGHRYAIYAEVASDGSLIVAGESLAEVDRAVDGLARLLLAIDAGTIFAALLVGWWLAGRALAPTRSLTRQLASIGVGELGRRVGESGSRDEVGRLTRAINAMLERVDQGVDRERAFVTAASHDLRTPIAALRTELELAMRPDTRTAELRDAIRNAHSDSIRLGNLANDLLTLAQAEPGGRAVLRRPVSVAELVAECAVDQSAIAGLRGVHINADAPDVEVLVDRLRIEQAIRNLLSNAISHSPPGETVDVHAAVRALASDSNQLLEVEVLDRGPGVSADIRRRLFVPFSAGDGGGHYGLGLSTAAAAVRAHGGSIAYADRVGGGARFAFSVPA